MLLFFFESVQMERRRKRRSGGEYCGKKSTEEIIYLQLRQVQQITGCTTQTLNVMLQKLHPFLKGCEDVKKLQMPRIRARRKSPFKKQMHGCVGPDCFYIFGPENTASHCPQCGDSRYSPNGKPKEVCHYLSLSQQIIVYHIYIFHYVMHAGVLVLPSHTTITGTA